MITVERLTKRYGPFTAVDDISFEVKPGLVTGFLGPNGAGKTTAMRVMAGLTPATSGRATVLGRPYAALPNPGRHVGLLLDASAQHAGRTGREVPDDGAHQRRLARAVGADDGGDVSVGEGQVETGEEGTSPEGDAEVTDTEGGRHGRSLMVGRAARVTSGVSGADGHEGIRRSTRGRG